MSYARAANSRHASPIAESLARSASTPRSHSARSRNRSSGIRASTRWLDDTLLPDERNTEASFRIRWLLRELELTPSFEFYDRRREDTVTREYRMLLRAVRRF